MDFRDLAFHWWVVTPCSVGCDPKFSGHHMPSTVLEKRIQSPLPNAARSVFFHYEAFPNMLPGNDALLCALCALLTAPLQFLSMQQVSGPAWHHILVAVTSTGCTRELYKECTCEWSFITAQQPTQDPRLNICSSCRKKSQLMHWTACSDVGGLLCCHSFE